MKEKYYRAGELETSRTLCRPAEHGALAVAEVPTPPTAVVAARNPDTTTRRVPSVLSKRQLRAVLAIYLMPRPCHSVAIRHRSLLSRSNCLLQSPLCYSQFCLLGVVLVLRCCSVVTATPATVCTLISLISARGLQI